jgi:multiple sugar transport system permease protein
VTLNDEKGITSFKASSLSNRFWTQEDKIAFWFLLPSMAMLLAFMFYPIFYVFVMSVFKTNRVGEMVRFVGLDNFRHIFQSEEFTATVLRTIVWTLIAVFVKTVSGLAIALILKQRFMGRKLARALVLLPWAGSIPISVMVWKWTFNNDFGLLNYTLRALGLDPPIWLAYPVPAFFATLTVDIWLGIPFMALVFLAGLQAIPKDLFEAAAVEGATAWQQFRHVTLPSLKPILLIATLLSFLWTFNDFNVIYILTKGGPLGKTEILITLIYRTAFEYTDFSSAGAIAIITFVVLLIVSLIYARFYFKTEYR